MPRGRTVQSIGLPLINLYYNTAMGAYKVGIIFILFLKMKQGIKSDSSYVAKLESDLGSLPSTWEP